MFMKTGERWHCINPGCGCEIIVQSSGKIEGTNPICACGAKLKKKYAPPAFMYLDFLREAEPLACSARTRGE